MYNQIESVNTNSAGEINKTSKGNIVWHIIKVVFSLLVFGKMPKPDCQHNWGQWCVLRKHICQTDASEYDAARDYYGVVTISRTCPECGEVDFRDHYTGRLESDTLTSDMQAQLSECMDELEANLRETYNMRRPNSMKGSNNVEA